MGINANVSIDVGKAEALDLLWGVDAIAQELNLSRRQTYYQLESGRLPARKQCGRWCASRVGLRKFFRDLLAGDIPGNGAGTSQSRCPNTDTSVDGAAP
jgi:hypothetical protein